MEFKLEQRKDDKAYTKYVNEVFDGEVQLSGFIAPNVFPIEFSVKLKKYKEDIDGEYYKKVFIERNFSVIGADIWNMLAPYNKHIPYVIVGYIANCINYNSNLIRITHDLVRSIVHKNISARDLINSINLLEEKNIIRRTDKRSIYTVNPIMIFKGNINILAEVVYTGKFNSPIIENDKLIIDKICTFEDKDCKTPIVIKNTKYHIYDETENYEKVLYRHEHNDELDDCY